MPEPRGQPERRIADCPQPRKRAGSMYKSEVQLGGIGVRGGQERRAVCGPRRWESRGQAVPQLCRFGAALCSWFECPPCGKKSLKFKFAGMRD